MSRRIGFGVITFVVSLIFLCLLFVTLSPVRVLQATALQHAPQQEDGQPYIVESGDSLYKIAEKFYGNGNLWPVIEQATNEKAQSDKTFALIRDAQFLRVGQKLWIPNQPTATTAAKATTAKPAAQSETRAHFVSPANGAVVPSTFQVVMAATGVKVEPAGEVHPNSGHMHILIDEDFVDAGEIIINDPSHRHFGKGQLTTALTLTPGIHVLRLQFADGAHMALNNPQLLDTITVTVAGAEATSPTRGVRFVSPQSGAIVSTTVDVVMAASGVTVEKAGEIHENAGHMHILVDEAFVPPGEIIVNDPTHHHFGKGQLTATLELDPGIHVLRLQLADGAHMALDDAALQDTITVIVSSDVHAVDSKSVRFVSPVDGATVTSPFEVVMSATGVTVEKAGEIHENAGHMHILVDEDFVTGGEIIINDPAHLHFGKGQLTTTLTLDPGVHVLRLQLADGAHMAFDDPRLRDTVTITVAE